MPLCGHAGSWLDDCEFDWATFGIACGLSCGLACLGGLGTTCISCIATYCPSSLTCDQTWDSGHGVQECH
ncbi:MAG: hypothetical protein JRI25_03720 [Deltaproteobacteria bacterium]|nr:hypothetical protein [Deltaproteobacteria bacterium]